MRYLLLACVAMAVTGCSPPYSRLNPGQEPAVYSANPTWINAQIPRGWESYGPGVYPVGYSVPSWRDPQSGAIYVAYDLTPSMKAREIARYTTGDVQ